MIVNNRGSNEPIKLWRMRFMIKIFIAGGITSQNKGEDAILIGMLETFKIIGDVKVSFLSFYPEIDSAWHDSRVRIVNGLNSLHLVSDLLERSRIVRILESISALLQHILFALFYKIFGLNATKIMRGGIWKEYCGSDLIIVAHGYILYDIYGFVLFFSPLYTIFLAKLLKKPVVIYAATIGPFGNKLWTILARFFLNKVDLIMLREEISYEYLQKIGVDKPSIFVTADTAFLLQPATPERVKEIMSKENINKDTPIIGMSVTRNIFHRAFPELKKQDKYGEYIKLMARVVDYLSDTLNATIVFVSHALGPGKKYDDRIAANEIYRVVKNKQKVRVITNEYTSGELKGVIGQFDLFIGERNHSVISSTSMFVPSIAISFPSDYRIHGITGKMLGQERWIYNIETLDYDTLISKISEAWSDKEDTKKDLMLRIDTVKEQALLNGRLIKDLLDSLKKDAIK